MAKKNVQLINEEIYHICYRAVGDSVIFNDENDYYRGIFSLYELNNANAVSIWLRRIQRKKEKLLQGRTSQFSEKDANNSVPIRDIFVEILAFCFMPNHIHLLLKQLKDGGISQFMQKVGGGYANYFNKKHNRKGHLFNRFKAFHIATNDQLKNVVTYIHCNPISLIEPGWKENGIKNPKAVLDFLENTYRWSSYWDYLGKKNFPSVTNRDFILGVMDGSNGIKEAVRSWVNHKSELEKSLKSFNISSLE